MRRYALAWLPLPLCDGLIYGITYVAAGKEGAGVAQSFLLIDLVFVDFLMLIGLAFIVTIDPYIRREHRRIMLLIVTLCFTLIVQNLWEHNLSLGPGRLLGRTLCSIYGYAIRPVFLILFLYIVQPKGKRWIWWALAGINALVYCTALFSPICFTFSQDNHYVSGPLAKIAGAVGAFLLKGSEEAPQLVWRNGQNPDEIVFERVDLTAASDIPEEFPPMPAQAAAFQGEWQCDRASISMNWEEEGFRVLIRWGSSAWDHTEWEYSCFYHEENNTLVSVPFGTRTDYKYGDDGVLVSCDEVYNDGQATFSLDGEGRLIWQDEKENAGEGMRFERLASQ